MPFLTASSFTGQLWLICPLPLGLSGWVTAATMSWPALMSASRDGAANAGVPMKTILAALWVICRSCGSPALRSYRSLLGFEGLPVSPFDQLPFEPGEPVYEKDAVYMVYLVLQGYGQKAFGFDLKGLAVPVQGLYPDYGGPFDIGGYAGHDEATFLIDSLSFSVDYLRVDKGHEVLAFSPLFFVLVRHIEHHDPSRVADLDRGQPDSSGIVHRFHHVVDELPYAVVH